jgi:hypothetical protein
MLQPDKYIRNSATDTPFSSMSAQLYPNDSPDATEMRGTDHQLADDPHDPVHDALQQNFSIVSNQKQGGDDADSAISLVKDFALHQAAKKAPLKFDEARNVVLNHVVKTEACPAANGKSTIPAFVYTDMTNGRTWFHNPDTNENFEIQTSNDVTSNAREGADDPYVGNITRCEINNLKELGDAFGTVKIYTTDNRSRWIHGGGTDLDDPYAPHQGWKPTLGCTRGQNEDLEKLCGRINEWKLGNPNRPIVYIRTRSITP